jgi:flagellin-like protein
MNKQKGITPIIAILVILLITIAITGSAWIYISTYYGGITRETIEVTSADCTGSGVQIYMRNAGTETVNENSIAVSRDVIANPAGGCQDGTVTVASMTVAPGASGSITDAVCNSTSTSVVRYTLIVGGRVQKVQVNC